MRNPKRKIWYHCVSILLILVDTATGGFAPAALQVYSAPISTVAVKAASQTYSTTRELTEALGRSESRSELRARSKEPDVMFPEDITLDHISMVGAKSAVLAAFWKFLISQGYSVRVPNWFSLTYARMEKIMKRGRVSSDDLRILQQALKKLSKDADQFADPTNPFLVSLRAANLRVFPGRFITILNVGINDQNIQAVAKKLESEELAWELYAKLIRDYAIAGEKISEDSFDDELGKSDLPQGRMDQLKETVRRSKQIYLQVYGREFPQDSLEQISLGILSIASAHRHGIEGPTAYNSVMVQRMVFGNRENSLSGNVFSRDPVTGEKKLDGAIGFGVQGDDLLDAKGFDEFTKSHPDLVRELELIGRFSEKFLRDIGSIEFTVEHGHFYLLQLRPATKSPLAMVQASVDMVKEGIITKQEALHMMEGIDLESLKYEPISEDSIPEDAVLLGQGRSVGVSGVFAGVAAISLDQAVQFRRARHPVIYTRPVITANDELAIKHSAAVVASRELGNHAQSIALRYGAGAVVDIGTNVQLHGEKLEVDLAANRAFITGPDGARHEIIPGETVLMIDSTGKIYIRKVTINQLDLEQLTRRRQYLPRSLVEMLRWQIEQKGKRADFIVDAYGHGERVAWAEIGRAVRVDDGDFDIMKDIIRPHNNTAVLVGVQDVIESDQPIELVSQKPKPQVRLIPLSRIDAILDAVVSSSSIETFTYELWRRYDNLERLIAIDEGFDRWNYESQVQYSNAEDARAYYIRKIAERARQKFIEAVVHGVDRHKMTAFIFRSSVVRHFDAEFSQGFLIDVINYAAKNGYTGDVRGHDWQLARLFSTVVKDHAEVGIVIMKRLSKKGIQALVHELKTFYVNQNLNTKTGDSDFAPASDIVAILDQSRTEIKRAEIDWARELDVRDLDELIGLFSRNHRSELRREVFSSVAPGPFKSVIAALRDHEMSAQPISGENRERLQGVIPEAFHLQTALLMTRSLVFDHSLALILGSLAQSLPEGAQLSVIAPTEQDRAMIDEMNAVSGTQIRAFKDFKSAQVELEHSGLSVSVVASEDDAPALIRQYFQEIIIWDKSKLDSLFEFFDVAENLISRFQAKLTILRAA